MTTVRFHPQAWINDYAVDVDPEGPTDFDVSDSWKDTDLDDLIFSPNCPAWARNWNGPFRIEIVA